MYALKQGGALALKVALDNKDMFAGVVLIATALVSGSSVPSPTLVQVTVSLVATYCRARGV